MKAQDFYVFYALRPLRQRGEPARRNRQRIAARDDQFPDVLMRGEIGEGGVERVLVKQARSSGPDPRATKTEAAIDRADAGQLEQGAVGIAVDQPLRDLMGVVADGVGALLRQKAQFGGVGQELPADGVVAPLDQRRDGWRNGDAVERRDLGQRRRLSRFGKAGADQIVVDWSGFCRGKFRS